MGLKMRDWVWDDNRQAGSKAALTRGQNRCLILNLLIWAIFHSVSKNDKNEIEKVLRRSKGWLWSCSARGGKRGAGEDGQIYFPHIYSSYFLISITHIFPHISSYLVLLFPDISSYFLMWGAGEDGQIHISSYLFLIFIPHISSHFLIWDVGENVQIYISSYMFVHLPILTGIIILIRNRHGLVMDQ